MVSVVAPTHSLKGKPHWRRTQQVYALLNQAPPEATYDRLIELVRQSTGKGCSRKLISKWKKTVISHQLPITSKPIENNEDEPPTSNGNASPLIIPSEQFSVETTLEPNQTEAEPIQNSKLRSRRSSIAPRLRHERSELEARQPKIQNPLRERVLQVAKNTWSYVAATAIVVGLAGGGWLLSKDNSQPVIAQPAAVTQTAPTPRPQKLEPRTIKIHLTLSNPQDLKVKPGDEVTPGQVLSDRTTERQRLLAQKKQLQLSLNKLDIPIPELIPPEAIPALGKLPPVSYQQEEANIALKQQELAEAEKAIANQKEKIKQLETVSSEQLPVTNNNSLVTDNWSLVTEQSQSMEIIIEHEQAVLEQLVAARDKAKLQLDIAKSQLLTAKERRAHAEYQRYVEETKRAIALQQQRIELERQRGIRAGQLQEREYSKAQIEAKIQEIDNAIAQLSTVQAPYKGNIKKIKWTGQDNHNLSVELTLDVDDGSESGDTAMLGQ